MNGLENILRLGEQEVKTSGGPNPYAVIIEEVFGLDKIEFLQVCISDGSRVLYKNEIISEPRKYGNISEGL